MPNSKKNYKGAKHSNAHVTPDCESVRTLAQAKSAFPLKEKRHYRKKGGNADQHAIGNIDESNVANDNTFGEKNNVQSGNANTILSTTQNNVHGKNIHAQTVNIYEYPKELIELIKKLSL
jgi:hypothetical protein